ncbi:carbohydrate ABC transporter permease [Paenibacillus xanthanilyticus]|uniref:Carbohydrate ABC transporter permease n=1 Tax=Paenibacillus xanthanilyticus TaxID=1783531 RepID=A0ABV8K8T0_9BACL
MNQQAIGTGRRLSNVSARILAGLFLLVVTLLTVFPLAMMLAGSLKSNAELMGSTSLLPQSWQFSNYAEAWRQTSFARFTWNSVFVSVVSTVGTLLVAAMAAYVTDRRDFPGKRLYVAIQASTLFITVGAVVLRPQYDLMVKLQLHTSLWGVILILISAHASTYFILTGFFKSIPRELDEAAMIDGSGFIRTFYRVILPLLAPGLGVAGLFAFRHGWNEYILPLVFTMTSPKLQTLTVGLANLRYGSSAAMQTHLMLAGACLSILPMLLVYTLANRTFMQMTAGSLKG